MKGIKASQEGQTIQEYYSFYFIMCLATILYLILVFRYKKVIAWLDVKFAKPLTEALINNNQSRKKALIVGAVIFTLGFLMQLFVIVLN